RKAATLHFIASTPPIVTRFRGVLHLFVRGPRRRLALGVLRHSVPQQHRDMRKREEEGERQEHPELGLEPAAEAQVMAEALVERGGREAAYPPVAREDQPAAVAQALDSRFQQGLEPRNA